MSQESDFLLDDAEKIASILSRMEDNHSHLAINANNQEKPQYATIAHVSVSQNCWWISLNGGRNTRNRIAENRTVDLSGHVENVSVEILDLETSIDESQGRYDLLRLPMPSQLRYIQRRDCFRVEVDQTEEIPTLIASMELASPLEGKLMDLSFEGCRIRFDGIPESPFAESPARLDIEIVPPEMPESILAQGDIRHLRHDPDSETLYAGVYFVNLESASQARINHLVGDLQRSLLQRKAMVRA